MYLSCYGLHERRKGLDCRLKQWLSLHSHVQICFGGPSQPVGIRAISWNNAEKFVADYNTQLLQRIREVPPTHTTLQVGRTRDRFRAVTLGIYSVAADISVCPGVDSASKNKYQDIHRGKGGRCVRVTTVPPSCTECLVIWSLNRPEPSGPHRAVKGVALSLHFM